MSSLQSVSSLRAPQPPRRLQAHPTQLSPILPHQLEPKGSAPTPAQHCQTKLFLQATPAHCRRLAGSSPHRAPMSLKQPRAHREGRSAREGRTWLQGILLLLTWQEKALSGSRQAGVSATGGSGAASRWLPCILQGFPGSMPARCTRRAADEKALLLSPTKTLPQGSRTPISTHPSLTSISVCPQRFSRAPRAQSDITASSRQSCLQSCFKWV